MPRAAAAGEQAASLGIDEPSGAPRHGGITAFVILFGLNALLHLLWNPLFFKLRRPDWR